MNLKVLVEERSAEQALRVLLPRIVPNVDFEVRTDTCLVVLVDRDDDDCLTLKADMEQMAAAAGLPTVTAAPVGHRADSINRLAVGELEARFFGDVPALGAAYSRVPVSLERPAKYRDPDAVLDGTWEALEHVLHAAATEIARYMNVDANRSWSFQAFQDGVRRLVAGGAGAAQG